MKRYQIPAAESSDQGTALTSDPLRQSQTELEKRLRSLVDAAVDSVLGMAPRPGGRLLWLSISAQVLSVCFAVQVPALAVPSFLNQLGASTVSDGIPDVQVWVQKRASKRKEDVEAIDGCIIDVDEKVSDLIKECENSGVALPLAVWATVRGHKLLFLHEETVDRPRGEMIARRLALALPSADPRSWSDHQGQRLPTCLKSTEKGVLVLHEEARLVNPELLPVSAANGLPHRLAALLGSKGALSPEMRKTVERYLDDLGTPAPPELGRRLYDRCPLRQHSAKKCYVNRRADGSVFVHCLGGHEGQGPQSFNEFDLARLANPLLVAAPAVDPVGDVPATHAGFDYVGFRFRQLRSAAHGHGGEEVFRGAVETWREEKVRAMHAEWIRRAEALVREGAADRFIAPDLKMFDDLISERLRDPSLPTSHFVEFDRRQQLLQIVANGERRALKSRSDSLRMKPFVHIWRATQLFRIGHALEERGSGEESQTVVVPTPEYHPDGESLLVQCRKGLPPFLSAAGVARVDRFLFPVAFEKEHCTIEPTTKVVEAVVLPPLADTDESFDALEFFLELFRTGRLPLASENDVRHFVAAIAAPLLRALLPGQLGIYWFVGPPGSGKDFLAEMIALVWETVGDSGAKVKFDLDLSGELELKRSLATSNGALICRAKEAGKRAGMVELLIRTAGTDQVASRALYEDERAMKVDFVIVGDSAENLPDRREIYRRTAPIQVVHIDDGISKGAIWQEVRQNGPKIIASLKRLVESRGPEFYLTQANTQGRPLVPAALAKLTGAELPQVKGADLSELWEAMEEYTKNHGIDEGERNMKRARAGRDARDEVDFSSYGIGHFHRAMSQDARYYEFFQIFRSGSGIVRALDREVDYSSVKAGHVPYLRVEVNGVAYAFLLTRGNRRFIFVPEVQYLARAPKGESGVVISLTPKTASAPAAAAGQEDRPFVFNADDLLDSKGR